MSAARAIRKAIADFGELDAVLTYGGTFDPCVSGVPYFLYCDSNTALSAQEPHSWGAALTAGQLRRAIELQGRVYRGAAGIFTFSDFVRNSFIRDFGLPASTVHTVLAGPNVELDATSAELAERRSERPTILFVGREFERKGGPVLLEAFRLVRRTVPLAKLVIVGPSNVICDEPGVTVLGYLRKSVPHEAKVLQQAYREASVFCLPTQREAFGIVLLEAMLYQLPVVASRIWAIPEIVADGETGFTVPATDASGFAARLVQLLGDSSRARRMGATGKTRVLSLFSWNRVSDLMLMHIREHLQQRRRL